MNKNKPDLYFEDLSFKENIDDIEQLELPLSRQAFLLSATLVVFAVIVVFGRLIYINGVKGNWYEARAAANTNKETVLPSPRGIISDRFGEPLVQNYNAVSVYVDLPKLLKDHEEAARVVSALAAILAINEDDLWTKIRSTNFEARPILKIAEEISNESAIRLRAKDFSSVQILDDYARRYIDGPVFAHVMGYGMAAGIEGFYNDRLSGRDGRRVIYRNVHGDILEEKVVEEPRAGWPITLTIDADLERYFYARLKDGLYAVGSSAGVGIAIDPRNGAILALISLPSFDNNELADFLASPNQPLFNRAVSGLYNPGSTIKPLVALAALHENIISSDKEIFSSGRLEVPNPYDAEHPSVFLDWRPHGWVDLKSALARSSNVYFYEVGGGYQWNGISQIGLGIDRLKRYWQYFTLGQKTGVDLPYENTGFLPDPEEKEKRTGQIWRLGDTYNVSIGQGDLLLTPIQLVSFIASIANGGKIYQPFLAKDAPPRITKDYSDWSREMALVQSGLHDTVAKSYGTAFTMSALPFSVAGKTGSAQYANNAKTNAFFVGYAPDPTVSNGKEPAKIAILVLVENAREGSLNAIPIANDVLEWYYKNRLANGKADL